MQATQAAINTLDFHWREMGTGALGTGRGVALFKNALVSWGQGFSPLTNLQVGEIVEPIKEKARDAAYMRSLIAGYLLQGSDNLVVRCTADPEHTQKFQAAQATWLKKQSVFLDERSRTKIAETHQRVLKTADDPGDTSVFPVLPLDQAGNFTPIPSRLVGPQTLVRILPACGDITYVDLLFNLDALPVGDRWYTPIIGKILLMTDPDLTRSINLFTGGIYSHAFVAEPTLPTRPTTAALRLSGKVRAGNEPDLFSLLAKAANRRHFDPKQVLPVLKEILTNRELSAKNTGWHMGICRIKANYSYTGWLSEYWGGVIGLQLIRHLYKQAESNWDQVEADLVRICDSLLNPGAAFVNVTAFSDEFTVVPSAFWEALPGAPVAVDEAARPSLLTTPEREFIQLADASTNFTAANFLITDDSLRPHLPVVQAALRYLYLFPNIRGRIGAYGFSSGWDNTASGLYFFMRTFRDPDPLASINVFKGAADFLATLDLSERELTRFILGGIDYSDFVGYPAAAGHEALSRFLTRTGDDELSSDREKLLGTRLQDLHRVGEALRDSLAQVVIVGPQPLDGFTVSQIPDGN